MITMLGHVSLDQAIRLQARKITVLSRRDGSIAEYEIVRYAGYYRDRGVHGFLVRTPGGSLHTLSDIQLGLSGNDAVARFADATDTPF